MNDITTERLRELAALRPPRGKVLSLYVDLDPSQFGTGPARSSELRSLLDETHRRVEEEAHRLSHDDGVALRADAERLGELLTTDALPADGAAGLSVFASGPAGLLDVLRLPEPVERGIYIEDLPHLRPLADIGPPERWCAVLVARGGARFFLGPPDGLVEEDVGDFRRDEYEREIPERAAEHFRNVARTLERLLTEGRYERLALATTHEQQEPFEALLADQVRRRLAGALEVEEHASADAIAAGVADLARRVRERELAELLERVEAGHRRPGGHATGGLADTLEALLERRVEALLVGAGFTAAGARCPRCGRLGVDPLEQRCPVDGAALEASEDVVEDAIHAAFGQDARVVCVRDAARLPVPVEPVAAALRF